MSDFAEDITASLSADERFGGCRFAEMYNAEETGFPLKAPLICSGREECERMEPLIGKDECLLSSEKLILSVCTDAEKGGAFCEELARRICGAVLEADSRREIISVSVEKCMYDRLLFAYKVMMGFTLRERCRL